MYRRLCQLPVALGPFQRVTTTTRALGRPGYEYEYAIELNKTRVYSQLPLRCATRSGASGRYAKCPAQAADQLVGAVSGLARAIIRTR